MVDADVLRRTCAGYRAVATRIKDVEDAFVAATAPDHVRLEQLKRGLNNTFDTIKQLQLDLLPHFDPGDSDKDVEDTERIRDDMFASMAKVDYALLHLSSAPPTAATPTAVSTSRAITKLPKLSRQKFNGSLIGWSPFWDAYKAAIHDNASLTNVEKFSYLQTLLEGKAKNTVAGLALTEAKYSVVVDLLEHRFGDKEKTIGAHMEKLINLAPVLSDLHTGELKCFYDKKWRPILEA